jgi:hypothetical protein
LTKSHFPKISLPEVSLGLLILGLISLFFLFRANVSFDDIWVWLWKTVFAATILAILTSILYGIFKQINL